MGGWAAEELPDARQQLLSGRSSEGFRDVHDLGNFEPHLESEDVNFVDEIPGKNAILNLPMSRKRNSHERSRRCCIGRAAWLTSANGLGPHSPTAAY